MNISIFQLLIFVELYRPTYVHLRRALITWLKHPILGAVLQFSDFFHLLGTGTGIGGTGKNSGVFP